MLSVKALMMKWTPRAKRLSWKHHQIIHPHLLTQVSHLQPMMKAKFLMIMALCHYLRRVSRMVCTLAPFFGDPVATRRRGRGKQSCWMMSPSFLIASQRMAFGTEPDG
uniref:Uncharacterized protein n=1 Tax=Arundo donax TaxID=35708 RepID=A0A0A9F0X6_ARUDO